jgi:hypothetical protein
MNLFDYASSIEENEKDKISVGLFEAYYLARKNKAKKISQIMFEFEYESKLIELADEIMRKEYEPLPYKAFLIHNPVLREVFAASFRDRVIHHFIFMHINKIFEKEFIEDSYSCRKNKGTLYGIKRVSKFIKQCSENYTRECYILKLDLEGYFYNIDKKLLFGMIKSKVEEKRELLEIDFETIMFLIEKTIFHNSLKNVKRIGTNKEWKKLSKSKSLFFAKKDRGLPIGNLTSQLFSNIYMDSFDKFVKNELGIKYYGRYVDDFIIIHNDKNYIKSLIDICSNWLKVNLSMNIHPKKIYVQPYQRGVAFLGSYIKPHVMYVGKRTKNNFYKLIKTINNQFMSHIDDMEYYKQIRMGINSYLGSMQHYSSFKLRKKILGDLIKEFWVCFGVDKEYKRVVLNCKYGFYHEQLLSSSRL